MRFGLLCSAVILGLFGCALIYICWRKNRHEAQKSKINFCEELEHQGNYEKLKKNDTKHDDTAADNSLLKNDHKAVSYNSMEKKDIQPVISDKVTEYNEYEKNKITTLNYKNNQDKNSMEKESSQSIDEARKKLTNQAKTLQNEDNNDDDSENVDVDDDDDKQKSAKCIVVNNTEVIEEVQKVLASPIAGGYNDEYQQRMRTMTQTLTSDEAEASPFIGFSLAQYASSKTLVVDGLFRDGPAYQTGIRIGDNLLCIADIPVETIEDVRNVVAKYCHCGRITDFTLRHPLGDEYTVQLWIMTVDPQFAGQPFFFDVNSHVREESPSRKRYVVGSDELEEIIHVTPQDTPLNNTVSESASLSSLSERNNREYNSNVSRSLINEEDVEQEYGSPQVSQSNVRNEEQVY